MDRKDVDKLKTVFLCEKHFEEKYLNSNESRIRLYSTNKSMLPVPTLLPKDDKCGSVTVCTNLKVRKPPTVRVLQQDQFNLFKNRDSITTFDEINESLLKLLPESFHILKKEDHVAFCSIEDNACSVPVVTYCIKINKELHVKLFCKGSLLHLPAWFCKGRNATFTSKSMLQNFIPYIKEIVEKFGSVLEEIHTLKYQTHPMYYANLIRYALSLRYSSLSAYKLLLEEFKLPSILLLRRITSGKIDALAAAEVLKNNKKISEDIILMCDEVYLQKCEEYMLGESFGANKNGELYKRMMRFMIIGLKSNVPYMIKPSQNKKLKLNG